MQAEHIPVHLGSMAGATLSANTIMTRHTRMSDLL